MTAAWAEDSQRYTLEDLEKQKPVRYRRTRFSPDLEAQFLQFYLTDGRYGRLFVILMPMILFGFGPLYGRAFFHTPDALVPLVRAAEFGVVLPTMAIALLCTLYAPLKKYSEAATMAAGFALCVVAMSWSSIGMYAGFPFPSIFSSVYVTALFVLARITFRRMIWVASAVLALILLQQYYFWGTDERMRLDLFAQATLFIVGAFGGYLFEFSQRTAWLQGRMLQFLSCTDPLTGINNRRGFNGQFSRILRQSRREQRPLAVMVLDCDHFKQINDHRGHEHGDAVLKVVAQALAEFARRPLDFCGRLGGEEFALVLYNCEPAAAEERADAVVAMIAALDIANPAAPTLPKLTISVGCISITPDDRTREQDILRRADKLLYKAKHEGRNRAMFEALNDPMLLTGNWVNPDALKKTS